jgi:hypothetical protein
MAAITNHIKREEFPNFSAYMDALLKNETFRTFMEDIYIVQKYTFEEAFAVIIDLSDYVLHLIDKSGTYQSDIKDLTKEFQMFRQNKNKESEKQPK